MEQTYKILKQKYSPKFVNKLIGLYYNESGHYVAYLHYINQKGVIEADTSLMIDFYKSEKRTILPILRELKTEDTQEINNCLNNTQSISDIIEAVNVVLQIVFIDMCLIEQEN